MGKMILIEIKNFCITNIWLHEDPYIDPPEPEHQSLQLKS